MSVSTTSVERLLSIYLALGQYPILSGSIRARMRRKIFERGSIQANTFETAVREAALRSQEREGLRNPYSEEEAEVWELRLARVREQLTDLFFSQNFTFEEFEKLIGEVLSERGVTVKELALSFNPEMAPLDMVFEQAITIERLPIQERTPYEARLKESKVVLIRSMISDQLRYINIAREWFTLADLAEIRRRKIGSGRIGGKAAGMLLAARILADEAQLMPGVSLSTPESWFIGSDEVYTFMSINNLGHWNDQKYKTEEEMRSEYPQIVREFQDGAFPPDIIEKLHIMLVTIGRKPLIVRSSSLLEDNFGAAFAGKYESIFLPNQGEFEENLESLTRAIARVYATVLNPSALLYRRSRGLLDYDERMALLIQVVQGETTGRYYLPHGAGVAFSRNQYRWAPQIRREDGFVRLVWGLGTRAVDRVGNDYPRLIALSHPLLRPNNEIKSIRRYSQQFVDAIDLESNQIKTVPIQNVLRPDYPPLRYLAQMDEDGYLTPIRSNIINTASGSLVITFDELLRRTPFARQMKEILSTLEHHYRSPVDMEFTLSLKELETGHPRLNMTILQCRPQSHLLDTDQVPLPVDLPKNDLIFSTRFVVPQGYIERVGYVIYIVPEGYFALANQQDRSELGRTIGQLNKALVNENFFCVGPGRWGSSNSDLGVPIDFSHVYNCLALVELAGQGIGPEPEPSLGTHFFQDLLEAQIYPLAVILDDPNTIFNDDFFRNTPNRAAEFFPVNPKFENCLRLIRVEDFRPGYFIRVVMNDEKSLAVAYLMQD
jgi:hypothetical protein